MPPIDLNPFQFTEIDNLCISARMRIETDSRIKVIRDAAQRLIAFSEIPFASTEDAYTELSHQAIKLLAREGFNSEDKNDVALIIGLLATEYRHLPTVDKGLSYEDVFKKCYSSYLDCADGPASEEQIEQLKAEVDRIVFERSMYNTYLFMEEYLNAAFDVMREVQVNREYCARELAMHLDSKRDRETPRGDVWCSIVSKILLRSKSLKDAIKHDFHLDSKEDLHIHDICHNFKHIEYTDEFFLKLFEAFKRNENEYQIQDAINRSDFSDSNNGPEILVYDRCINEIKTAFFNTYETSCVPIYCMGTVNDYVCAFLNIDMSRFSGNLEKIYQCADLYEADEKQISAQACDRIDRTVQAVFDMSEDDGTFQKAHIYFVRRWLEYKVNLDLCSRTQFISNINDLFQLKDSALEELPQSEKEKFEKRLSHYFSEFGMVYGYNFFDYLNVSIPIVDDVAAKQIFSRTAYCKTLVDFYLTKANEIISESKEMRIIEVLSKRHSPNYYFNVISEILDAAE